MKYGSTFYAKSVPQWAPYNIDYNELKTLIKVHTTKDQAQAIPIPGQEDTALAKFEQAFFNELSNQHDRVDLFVNSKADEISRRLDFLQKAIPRLLARIVYGNDNGKPVSQKKWEKFAKYDRQIAKCGDEIKALQRFVDAQRTAFHKILKKYKKWTGSQALGDRFKTEVLGNPKSFTRRDFEPLLQQYNDLLTNLRASTPTSPEVTTPSLSRRQSVQTPIQEERQTYWNEFDDGSDVENEPYTIYIDPDAESQIFGAKTFSHIFSRARGPLEKVREWLTPISSPQDRRPLLQDRAYFAEQAETDVDDIDASSSEFPSGYATHYATFPSIHDQRFTRAREQMLFRATVASFTASLVLLLVASLLVATGKHKLRIEVDAGATLGIVSSLFFATLGFGTMLYRSEKLSWLHRGLVGATFAGVCILNGILLVIVVGDTV